jgi:uncharacterized glyoxalase superfamily protein PhnB
VAIRLKMFTPTLRGIVLDGRDKGSVSFGSAQDWFNAHGGGVTMAQAVQKAMEGGEAATFRDARGSFWSLRLHRDQPWAAEQRAA